jgi:hypothetical protein
LLRDQTGPSDRRHLQRHPPRVGRIHRPDGRLVRHLAVIAVIGHQRRIFPPRHPDREEAPGQAARTRTRQVDMPLPVPVQEPRPVPVPRPPEAQQRIVMAVENRLHGGFPVDAASNLSQA